MSAATRYVLLNESKASELAGDALEKMRADLQSAYDTVFAPAWGALPVEIHCGEAEANARVLHLVDEIPEAPDALAYHTVDDQGRPVLRLGVETIRAQGGVLLDEISKAASHEMFETAVNPFVAYYATIPNHDAMLALEVCDPVQGASFVHGATAISDFVLPAYFDIEDVEGPYDYCATLRAPLSCAEGGYQAFSDGTNFFGALVSHEKRVDVALRARPSRCRVRPSLVVSNPREHDAFQQMVLNIKTGLEGYTAKPR